MFKRTCAQPVDKKISAASDMFGVQFYQQVSKFAIITFFLSPELFIFQIKFNLETFFMFLRLGKVENVDTSTFRTATWNYIHLVYGIYHDDYLYTEVCYLHFMS